MSKHNLWCVNVKKYSHGGDTTQKSPPPVITPLVYKYYGFLMHLLQ